MTRIAFVLAASLALVAANAAHAAAGEPVTLRAADGVTVYGQVWRAAGAKPPLIVAFHQAESSSAEYEPIAPRLVEAGFTVLAIDQRSGDGAFGGTNRTAAALGRAASYDEALFPISLRARLGQGRRQGRAGDRLGLELLGGAGVRLSPPRIRATSARSSPSRPANTSPASRPFAAPPRRSMFRSGSTRRRAPKRSRARRRS